jgi:hypothetical protein
MLQSLKRRGMEKPPWLTAAEFAGHIPHASLRGMVEAITVEYHALRYGHRKAAGPRMLALIEELETSLQQGRT